jgi:hypothetical protein
MEMVIHMKHVIMLYIYVRDVAKQKLSIYKLIVGVFGCLRKMIGLLQVVIMTKLIIKEFSCEIVFFFMLASMFFNIDFSLMAIAVTFYTIVHVFDYVRKSRLAKLAVDINDFVDVLHAYKADFNKTGKKLNSCLFEKNKIKVSIKWGDNNEKQKEEIGE